MSLQIMKDSNNVEDFVPMGTNTNVNECYSCRRAEATDRMKLTELSSQTAALSTEETKLKSLHRRLEMRMKRFLHRTRNSILMQEKLLNMEKCAHKELLTRKNLLKTRVIHKNEKQQLKLLSADTDQIQKNNVGLENEITSICNEINQMEKDLALVKQTNGDQFEDRLSKKKNNTMKTDDRLHRMNLELNTIRGNNSELRTDIKRMLEKRREMIAEYDRLSIAMQNATDESRQLTSECSESFGNRRNLVARMQAMRDQHERDEKKLLEDIRELDRLLESNQTSKNFILQKSNIRREQMRLNELLAGKRSNGAKSAYTADEFHHLFRHGFGQNFEKEKVLNRAVETFLNEQDQSFSLFEYAVELINELNHLREELDKKRKRIANIFSKDNVDSLVVKDVFALLEHSVSEAGMSVQSLETAKENGRELLNAGYQLLETLFVDVGCDTQIIKLTGETVNDQNILIYLAAIESRVQHLLATSKSNRRGLGGTYTDDTTVSWRMHRQHASQPMNSFLSNTKRASASLHELDSVTPQIPSAVEYSSDGTLSLLDTENATNKNEKTFRAEVVDTVLNVYHHRNDGLAISTKNHAITTGVNQISENK